MSNEQYCKLMGAICLIGGLILLKIKPTDFFDYLIGVMGGVFLFQGANFADEAERERGGDE